MSDFLKIITLYQDISERTIENLSSAYNDRSSLINILTRLVSPEFLFNNQITGKRILIKPNWVLHNRNSHDAICLRTNENVILALLEVILSLKPQSVIIGDAPIQGCDWDNMLPQFFYEQIEKLTKDYKIPVLVKDFRRVTFSPDKNNPVKERNPISDYNIFDIGSHSYLEPIAKLSNTNFRVTNYDPDRLTESHSKGVHKYCITKELFEADVVISMPKIKTHQKTGITAALKNLVGFNGDKDYLPHHRLGGTGFGGDCYPGKNYLRYWAELFLDNANRNQGKSIYWFWTKLSAFFWKLSSPKNVHQISAAWYGNDTTWRMVMDINTIAVYGKADGTLSNTPLRKIYSLGDGIIAGQGDGPLRPVPLPLGVLTFSDNSALHDIAVGILFRFAISKIPLLEIASKVSDFSQCSLFLNGSSIEFERLWDYSIETLPPPGWVDYLKQ